MIQRLMLLYMHGLRRLLAVIIVYVLSCMLHLLVEILCDHLEPLGITFMSLLVANSTNDLKYKLNKVGNILTLKALTNSWKGKLLSCEGSGMSMLLPSQNSLFLSTIFLRSSNVITTGYTLHSLHNLKNSIAEIFWPSVEN